MLVSHDYDFIYTKTNKTAGTSVESFFERYCMPEEDWQLSYNREETISAAGIIGFRGQGRPENCRYWNHMPARLIRQRLGDETWARYFKFCVVRNPYDKTVSQYYFQKLLQQGKKNGADSIDLDAERQSFEDWLAGAHIAHDKDKYLIDGEFCMDDVIRFENLEREVNRICDLLSIASGPAQLTSFMGGIRPAEATTKRLFSTGSKQIVEEKYAFELEHFGYSFPNSS